MLFRNDKKDNPGAAAVVPLLPLRELIVFPHDVYPIFVGRQKSIKALEASEASKRPILLVTQKDPKVAEPAPGDLYAVGTLGVVVQLLRLPDGTVKALVEGKKRARVLRYVADEEYFQVEAEEIEETNDRTTEVEALMRSVVSTFDNYARLNKKIPPEMVTSIAAVDDPAFLADKLVGHLGIKLEDKQALLESTNPAERLEKILGYMRSELEILEVEKRIRSRVKKQMEKTSKEYYLNEQMRAIQKELGEKDEFKNEIQELEEKLRQKKMPAEAREKCEREIKKLKMMSPMSAEATAVRNYLDWFLALPWFEYTEDKLDIKEAERILEEDHYGLEKVKERILEYLAVQTLVGQLKGPILCLVGPGCGQDLAGQVGRAGDRTQVCAGLAGWGARRGRNLWPSPDLHRRAARQGDPVHAQGRVGQSRDAIRRGRQDVDRFPRRPVCGPARSARPRAEQHLQRPLPGLRLRPLQGDVHHHRQHAGADSALLAGPPGDN